VVCVGACCNVCIYIVHGVQSIMMKETAVEHVNSKKEEKKLDCCSHLIYTRMLSLPSGQVISSYFHEFVS